MYQQNNQWLKWVGIIALGLIAWFFYQHQNKNDNQVWLDLQNVEQEQIVETLSEDPMIGVHIAGEVKRPGVYFLKPGARVVDLIKAAGGVTKDADLNQLNLAAPLFDGEKIVVLECQRQTPFSQPNQQTFAVTGNSKININTANKTELINLPGIGSAKAEAIIQYRQKQGKFKKLEELQNVSGIGEKTFLKLIDQITLY